MGKGISEKKANEQSIRAEHKYDKAMENEQKREKEKKGKTRMAPPKKKGKRETEKGKMGEEKRGKCRIALLRVLGNVVKRTAKHDYKQCLK